MKSTIVLTGLSGSGKTSVGKALAERLSWSFIDTDLMIEAEYGSSVGDIFASRGEPFFRELETLILERLASAIESGANSRIISTGGGAVISPYNRQLLKRLGHVIFLTAPVALLAARLSGDSTRPLLMANPTQQQSLDNKLQHSKTEEQNSDKGAPLDNLILKLENLLLAREAAYLEADLIVDTSECDSSVIANRITELLKLSS